MKKNFRTAFKMLLAAVALVSVLTVFSLSTAASVGTAFGDAQVMEAANARGTAFNEETAFRKETYISESNGITIPYRLYLPADYDESKAYPLILFLHGAGERGNDNVAQLKNGILIPFNDPSSPIHNCIVLAPQCPAEYKWVEVPSWQNCQYSTKDIAESKPLAAVVELLEVIQDEYSVDIDRIYATGISMGGYGTWDLLARHGKIFAAAIPVCGGVDASHAKEYQKIPIYTFHGLKDTTVPPTGTLNVVEMIQLLGGNKITLVTYPDSAHSIWNAAYSTDGLITWLLSHNRSDQFEFETEDPTLDTTVSNGSADSTEAPETEDATAPITEPAEKKEGGCGSTLSATASMLVAMLLIFGVAPMKKN